MNVNSAKEFRNWFKVKEQEDRPEVDENFMGCSYDTKSGKKIKGFFYLFHGKKDDIERYLPSLLDIAEDNQAIYEFLQNAVDCGATHFWVFYNDKYFLAVNNGSKFSLDGLSSILNIAQSTKTTASSIGRLGIGFKLAHRLVGKGNGTHELIHENKGPIMFSWDDSSQLRSLMSSDDIQCQGLSDNPFLLKIAITNFPAEVNERVKDINYNDVIVFPNSELEIFRSYTAECLQQMFSERSVDFSQGTLFFIELGENKRALLDADLATLKSGIEYSMNTLKQLRNICFNGESISKKDLIINESSISKTTDKFYEIDPQYKEYDILYSFGYLPLNFDDNEYHKAVAQLRQSPNFYKYFPMGDEVDNMALFVHSDSFQIEANRRKLTNHHTNRRLLPEIASLIINTLNGYKDTDRQKFLQLYAAILLTDKPTSQEKSWMYPVFFDKLYAAIKTCIPTKSSTSNTINKVKIKKIKIDIPLDKIGHQDKEWFAWDGETNKELLTEAVKSDKLGIEEWNINDIIVNADKLLLNSWLDSLTDNDFDAFLSEIKATTTSNEAKHLLPQIKLFRIGKDRKSQNEINSDTSYVISTVKNAGLKSILEKVGMKFTDTPLESHPLSSLLSAQNEKVLFGNIKTAIEANASKLDAPDKLTLVTRLSSFEGVADAAISQLKIFKNRNNQYCCLSNLMAYKDIAENWQLPYIICKEENFSEIQKYMVSSESMYNDIIGPNYSSIFDSDTSIDDMYSFYQRNGQPWDSSLTIKLIEKFGASNDILSLIEKTSDKNSVEAFIKKMTGLNLLTANYYASNSFEYRIIQLAAKVEATALRSKITIDEIKLSAFASSDNLSFKVSKDNKETTYYIKLSDVLPNDTQCAIYGKMSAKFSSISNYTKIFSADSSNIGNVSQRLQELLKPDGVLISPAQYAYILLTRAMYNYSSLGTWQSCVRIENASQVSGIISYCYQNGLMPILSSFKSIYPFSNFVRGKYLFSKEYTLETERADKSIEEWCGQDAEKKKALIALDMHFEDSAEIKRRKAFLSNTMYTWDTELTSTPTTFLNWVNSIKPVSGDNQQKLLLTLCQSKHVNSLILRIDFKETEDYSKATVLNTTKYNSWHNEDGIQIYTLETEMPCRIIYNDDKNILCNLCLGEYKFFNSTKKLYIKGKEESEIAASLAKVYPDTAIPFTYADYISVCFNSLEEQREINERLRRYEEQIKEIKRHQEENERAKEEYRKEYSEKVKQFMGSDFSMPADKIKSEHIITRYRTLMYIKNLGGKYTLATDFDEKSYIRAEGYAPIPLSDGRKVNVQGVKYGIWHLSPVIWNDIVGNGDIACLCTGNREYDFKLIENENDLKSIAKSTHNVFMRLTPTPSMNIMDTIKSVISPNRIMLNDETATGTIYTDRDVHLMLLVHPTPVPELNSMFDEVFNSEGDFNINELG